MGHFIAFLIKKESDYKCIIVCQRFEFTNLEDIRITMNQFRKLYYFERIHGEI